MLHALTVLAACGQAQPAPMAAPPPAIVAAPPLAVATAPADTTAVVQLADASPDAPVDASLPALAQTGEWPLTVPACTVKASGMPINLAIIKEQKHTRTRVAPASRDYGYSADSKEIEYYEAATNQHVAVPITGGSTHAVTATRPDPWAAARAHDAAVRPFADAMRRAGKSPGSFVVLSPTLAIGLQAKLAFEVSTTDVRQLTPAGLDLAFADALDEHRVEFLARDDHLWVADLATRTLFCATPKSATGFELTGPIVHRGDLLAYTLNNPKTKQHEIHFADLANHTDTHVANVKADQVLLLAVPGKLAFIVVAGGKTMQLHAVDGTTRAIARIAPELRGWSNVVIAPDGASLVVSQGELPVPADWRPPMPTSTPRPPNARPCDPVSCHGGCGWQSTGCWGYQWCGDCPGARPLPPLPLPDDGLYVIAL